jgi:hypothetical protein
MQDGVPPPLPGRGFLLANGSEELLGSEIPGPSTFARDRCAENADTEMPQPIFPCSVARNSISMCAGRTVDVCIRRLVGLKVESFIGTLPTEQSRYQRIGIGYIRNFRRLSIGGTIGDWHAANCF